MIARLDKTYYLADSLGRKRTACFFLTKKNWRMVPRKLQKNDNLCGFYAVFFSISFFKSTKFHDGHVLNFQV